MAITYHFWHLFVGEDVFNKFVFLRSNINTTAFETAIRENKIEMIKYMASSNNVKRIYQSSSYWVYRLCWWCLYILKKNNDNNSNNDEDYDDDYDDEHDEDDVDVEDDDGDDDGEYGDDDDEEDDGHDHDVDDDDSEADDSDEIIYFDDGNDGDDGNEGDEVDDDEHDDEHDDGHDDGHDDEYDDEYDDEDENDNKDNGDEEDEDSFDLFKDIVNGLDLSKEKMISLLKNYQYSEEDNDDNIKLLDNAVKSKIRSCNCRLILLLGQGTKGNQGKSWETMGNGGNLGKRWESQKNQESQESLESCVVTIYYQCYSFKTASISISLNIRH